MDNIDQEMTNELKEPELSLAQSTAKNCFSIEQLNVLFEDNHIIVVLKPINMPTCEDSTKDQDLLSLVKEYLKVKENKPGNVYVGMVHRLDRVTGGVMVFAKTSKGAARLSESIQSGDMEKRYLAVTVGVPRERQANLVNYLYKDEAKNKVYVVPMTSDGAKRAELDYKVLETNGGFALMDVRLITGRSHQIRVQMSTIGCPLVGDFKYGNTKSLLKLPLGLWATELKFTHPTTKEKMVFRVFPPDQLPPWKHFNIKKALAIDVKNN